MKKLVLAAIAASMVAAPAMAAPQNWHSGEGRNGHQVTQPAYRPAPVQQYRSWQKGQRFDSRYARNYRQVDYRGFHGRLKAPPRGYRYVQSGNDVVMVSIVGGLIGAVFANLLH